MVFCISLQLHKIVLNEQVSVVDKKGQPVERKTNIYGTYRSNASLGDNFEGDSSEQEDQYAVIRDSQVMSMIICTDKPDDTVSHVLPLTNCSRDKDDTVEEYDIFSNYNCQEYNHLKSMGVQRIPGQQKLMENIYTTKPKGKNDLSFQDE